METGDPDLPLVKALQGGDNRALTALIEAHETGLFRFIYRYIGNEDDAKDLAQETFVRVHTHLPDFKPRAKFKTWLYQIATNLCRDHSRRWASRLGRQSDSIDASGEGDGWEKQIASSENTPAERAVANEEKRLLHAEIRKLPHDLRTALVLFTLEGRSQMEVGEIMKITPKAVEARVYRAKKLLQERLPRIF